MVHFLRQLQAYCQLEVIECSWQSLTDFASKREGDLDALIQAHRTYLDRVVRKVLLLSSKRDREVSDSAASFNFLARVIWRSDADT
jgi:gamma-tubulin complex component 3